MKGFKLTLTLIELGLLGAFLAGTIAITNQQVKPTQVYQYKNLLTEGTIIEASDLQVVEVPHDALTEDFIRVEDRSSIIGQALTSDVYPGEYAIKSRLVNPENLDPFSDMDLSEYVKVVIPISNASAAGGMVNAGDLVDLVYMKEINGTYYSTRFMSEVLVYKVLDGSSNEVTNNLEKGEIEYDENGEPIGNAGNATMLVCAVKQDEALEIMTRLQTGSIHAIGRFDDTITKEDLQDFYMGAPVQQEMGRADIETVY